MSHSIQGNPIRPNPVQVVLGSSRTRQTPEEPQGARFNLATQGLLTHALTGAAAIVAGPAGAPGGGRCSQCDRSGSRKRNRQCPRGNADRIYG